MTQHEMFRAWNEAVIALFSLVLAEGGHVKPSEGRSEHMI